MTWPLQPIGPRPQGTPRIDPARPVDRRRERSGDEREQPQREHRDEPEQQGPDADGHIDVLA